MLIFTHRPGDWVHIRPGKDLPPDSPLRTLFARERIRIFVGPIFSGQVKLGVEVPLGLAIEVVKDKP
jgi:hypothetical protein